MPFNNSILAGVTLVRQAIQSEGFVTGSTGWRIERIGDAEFNDLIARGTFKTAESGRRVEITDNPEPFIRLFSGHVSEVLPATWEAEKTGSSIQTRFSGGWLGAGSSPELQFSSTAATGTHASLSADSDTITGNPILFNNPNADDRIAVVQVGTKSIVAKHDGINVEDWIAPTLLNSWVNFGDSSPPIEVRLYPDGDVMMRGVVKNGTNQIIANLSAKYRPPLGVGIETPISGGRGRLISNANGDITISGLPAGSTTFTELTMRWSTIT